MLANSITLDGLSGSGKTAVGLLLAEALNYYYLEPRTLYETLIARLRAAGINLTDGEQAIRWVGSLPIEVVPRRVKQRHFVRRREASGNARRMHFYKVSRPQPYHLLVDGTPPPKDTLAEKGDFNSYAEFSRWREQMIGELISAPALYAALAEKVNYLAEAYDLVMTGADPGRRL